MQVYTNIYKIYKIYTKYQAAAARPGPEAPGPALGPRLGAGPGRRRLVCCIHLVYICIYLCIFVYILYVFLYILYIQWYKRLEPDKEVPGSGSNRQGQPTAMINTYNLYIFFFNIFVVLILMTLNLIYFSYI